MGCELRRCEAVSRTGRPLSPSTGDEPDDDPVHNDWNGSAKIALLCLQRSRIAWQTLADAWGNADASAIAASITEMISSIERHFPDAASFVQPGLDHPHI